MSNWDWIELKEAGKIVTGSTPSTKDPSNYGNYIPFVKPPQLNSNYISEAPQALSEKGAKKARILPPNSVMVSCIGNLGMVAVNKCKMATNQQINSIIPNEDLYSKFLFYQVQSSHFLNQLDELSSATTVTIVNKGNFSKAKIAVPPLTIQHRIVEKIEELFSDLDNGIENLKKAKQQLETYKQSVLKAAFAGKLTAAWREQQDDLPTPEELKQQIEEERKNYREQQLKEWEQEVEEWKEQGEPGRKPRKPRNYKNLKNLASEEIDKLTDLPEGWIYEKLGNVCLKITDGTHKSPNNDQSGEYKYITAKNIKEYRIDLEDITYVSEEDHKKIYSRCDVETNDVLYIKDGATTGKATVNNLEEEFSLLSSVAVFRTPYNAISSKFLTYYLNSEVTRSRMLTNISGNAITRLTLTKLNNSILALCSDREQRKIVQELESRLSIVVELESITLQELKKAEALRQSILKKAFEGRLVDPVEESQANESISKFQQMQMIGHLIEVLQKNYRMQFGELVLVKYMYLIDRIYNFRTGFKFKKYNHGPYDPNFKELLYTSSNFFTRKDPGYFNITPAKRNQLLSKKPFNTEVYEEAINSISKFTKKFYPKGIAGKKLELLTTVCKIIEDNQSVNLKNIREEMANWEIEDEDFDTKAEKFTEDETERCLDFILKKGWEKELIN